MALKGFLTALGLSIVITGSFCSPAVGQEGDGPRCFPRTALLAAVAMHHNQTVVAGGVDGAGDMVEILATPDGSTWGLIVTRVVDGVQVSCILGGGENWRMNLPGTPGQDS